MADEITTYLDGVPPEIRERIEEIYAEVRHLVPEATVGLSYGMPSLLYRGKGLISVMSTRKHIGVYPYGNLGELAEAVTAAGLGSTKGSIHLKEGQRLPAELLKKFVARRIGQIEERG